MLEAMEPPQSEGRFLSIFSGWTLLIAIGVGVCLGLLVASKRRRVHRIDPTETETNQPTDSTERNGSAVTLREEAIAALAYRLWQDRGCPFGSDQQDWFRAEQLLTGRTLSIPTA